MRNGIVVAGALFMALGSTTAEAGRQALNPKMRVHAGVTISEGPNAIGTTFGVEARASRYVFLDIGGFVTPGDAFEGADEMDLATHIPRNGIFAAPGIRLPHAQPAAFEWDLTARVGPGLLWTAYMGERLNSMGNLTMLEADVMVMSGVDLAVKRGEYGVRLSGRLFGSWPHNFETSTDPTILMWQGATELFYQF